MGILRVIGKGAGFVGKSVAKGVAKGVTRRVARKVATKVAVTTIMAAVTVASAVDSVSHAHKENKSSKKLSATSNKVTNKNIKVDIFKLQKSNNFNKKEKKIFNILDPEVKTLNSESKQTYRLFYSLGSLKLTMLKQFNEFISILKTIKDLPECLPSQKRFDINVIPFNEFFEIISKNCVGFNDDSLILFIATHGFVDFDKDNFELINRIHPFEQKFYLIDVTKIEKYKFCIKQINEMKNIYRQLDKTCEYLKKKLISYSEKYKKLLKELTLKAKKKREFKKLSKPISSLYLSTLQIYDLMNTNIVVNEKINSKQLSSNINKIFI